MNFLNSLILWFIPAVVLAVLLLIWRARVRRSQILKSLLGIRWNDPEHVLISPARRSLRLWLFMAGILLLMLAAARPYWGSQLVPYDARGRDVMVLFDVSKSMLSEDIQPSRLEHAKWLLRQLVNDSNGDRFGLVAFAGNAFLECPMTTDKTSFIQYVDELSTSTIPLGGTNLQLALETAGKAFDAAESTNRAIVLITDGDELSGDSSRVLDSLKNQKIPLFIVGLGDPANPAVIPLKRGPGETPAFMRDASGNLVKTKLNEQQLVKLAKETGGIYVRSTVTDPGLDQIRQRIKDLVPKELDKGIRTKPIERFYYPLAVALALLLTWFILSERENTAVRSRKALLLFLLPGLLVAASGAKAADEDNTPPAPQPAVTLPSDTATDGTATDQEKKAAKDKPAALPDPVKTYNEGHDLQLKKDESAAKLYEQAINLAEKNPAVRARAYQNLGVIEHNKARQEMTQSVEQIKGQNLDGALEKLSGAEKILDKAEEMYVKSMSIRTAQPDAVKAAGDPKTPEVKKIAEEQKAAEAGNIQLEQNRAEVAIDQQKLLFDRDMIAELRKKIEELKKKQEEARKKTEEARKQQQQKQDKPQKDQKQNKDQQDQNKQDQNKQDQNKQDQNKQDQNKQDQNKQDQNKQDQNKQDNQQKQDQQKQQSGKDQKQNADQAMKDAQKSVDELKDQAQKLEQKKIEQNAEAARKELDKAEEAKKESKPEKADKHMKEALKYLGADDNNKNDKNDKNKNGGSDKDKKDQKDQKDKKDQQDKKDQDKQNQQDRKLNDQPAQAKAAQQEREIDPQQAKALLEVMAGKEKNLRDALKEQQQKMYGQIKVEKDW